MTSILEKIRPFCVSITPVGSRVTCDPPPTDTDADYLVFVKTLHKYEVLEILSLDADEENSGYAGERRSYRFGEINIILTFDPVFYNKFMASTALAKRFNLLDKQDRIDLFRAIRGEYPKEIDEDLEF